MSQLVWGKEIVPLGNIVQESHKMQMVSLNSTYIALLLFWEQGEDPPLSVAEMCELELNLQVLSASKVWILI